MIFVFLSFLFILVISLCVYNYPVTKKSLEEENEELRISLIGLCGVYRSYKNKSLTPNYINKEMQGIIEFLRDKYARHADRFPEEVILFMKQENII